MTLIKLRMANEKGDETGTDGRWQTSLMKNITDEVVAFVKASGG
jgi:hypothetical protein